MAFVIPENLHEDLYPLAWMIGSWAGTGVCEYPEIERFEYSQDVTFKYTGQNYLYYVSKTSVIDVNKDFVRPLEMETGFWRCVDKKIVEVVLAQSSGLSQSWAGIFERNNAMINLPLDRAISNPSVPNIAEGQRLYGNVHGQLFMSYDVAMNGHELQAYMWSTLARKVE